VARSVGEQEEDVPMRDADALGRDHVTKPARDPVLDVAEETDEFLKFSDRPFPQRLRVRHRELQPPRRSGVAVGCD
jgi:hypothetical protein